MEIGTKVGLAFGIGTVVVAGVGLFLSRQRSHTTGGFAGSWSTSVHKLQATGRGKVLTMPEQKRAHLRGKLAKRAVIVSWGLPPGPSPAADVEGNRGELRKACAAAGHKEALYDPALAKQSFKAKMGSLRSAFGPWWSTGTCPGCSLVCARGCYVAKGKMATSWEAQRKMWGNVCDVVEGKRLPEIFFDDCAPGDVYESRKGKPGRRYEVPGMVDPHRRADRPCNKFGKEWAYVQPKGDPDPYSDDVVVDSSRADSVFVRLHVSGDMFDPQYVRLWKAHSEKHVARYYQAMDEWRRGVRRNPPPRIYYWTYTRSWRIPDSRDLTRPHPQMIDAIRELPTLFYQDEYYPPWHAKAGQLFRGRKQAFGVLLSADSDTGIPWVKDKLNRIMPVAFVLAKHDLTSQREDGKPVVFDWDKKIPGIILRDHTLRSMTLAKQATKYGAFGRELGPSFCLAEVPPEEQKRGIKGKSAIKRRENCYSCRRCFPSAAQGIAEGLFKDFMVSSQIPGYDADVAVDFNFVRRGAGDDSEEADRRARAIEAYDQWKLRGPAFQMAVDPVETTTKKPLKPMFQKNVDRWLEKKLKRLPLVGERRGR